MGIDDDGMESKGQLVIDLDTVQYISQAYKTLQQTQTVR